jgi:hypothetical protein
MTDHFNLYNTPRYRTFAVKYIGHTNTRAARIKITDLRNKVSLVVSRHDDRISEIARTEDQAAHILTLCGISVDGVAQADESKETHSCFLLSHDFTTPLKK